jgi:hypothetical protein
MTEKGKTLPQLSDEQWAMVVAFIALLLLLLLSP